MDCPCYGRDGWPYDHQVRKVDPLARLSYGKRRFLLLRHSKQVRRGNTGAYSLLMEQSEINSIVDAVRAAFEACIEVCEPNSQWGAGPSSSRD